MKDLMKDLRIKILIGLLTGLILSLMGFSRAYAYSFGVSLNETTWEVDGTVVGYGNSVEKTSYFTATNNGTSLEGLRISATDDKGWTIGDTIAENVFVLEHKPTGGGSYQKISSDGNSYLKEELIPSDGHTFDLRLTLPTDSTDRSTHTITITLTAGGPSNYAYNATGDFYWKHTGTGEWTADNWGNPAYDYNFLASLYSHMSSETITDGWAADLIPETVMGNFVWWGTGTIAYTGTCALCSGETFGSCTTSAWGAMSPLPYGTRIAYWGWRSDISKYEAGSRLQASYRYGVLKGAGGGEQYRPTLLLTYCCRCSSIIAHTTNMGVSYWTELASQQTISYMETSVMQNKKLVILN